MFGDRVLAPELVRLNRYHRVQVVQRTYVLVFNNRRTAVQVHICSLLKLMRDARRAKVNTAVHFYSIAIVRGQIFRDCHRVIDLGRSFTYYCAQKNSLSIAHYPPVPLVIVPVLLLTEPFVSDGYIVRQGRSPITLIAGLNESPLILIRLGFRNKRTSYYHVRQKDTS